VLPGHGRPRRDFKSLVAANRDAVLERVETVRMELEAGPRTPYEIVPALFGEDAPRQLMVSWGLSEVLCYLRHLELRGEAAPVEGEDPARWEPAA
jgi:hypothetical protein